MGVNSRREPPSRLRCLYAHGRPRPWVKTVSLCVPLWPYRFVTGCRGQPRTTSQTAATPRAACPPGKAQTRREFVAAVYRRRSQSVGQGGGCGRSCRKNAKFAVVLSDLSHRCQAAAQPQCETKLRMSSSSRGNCRTASAISWMSDARSYGRRRGVSDRMIDGVGAGTRVEDEDLERAWPLSNKPSQQSGPPQ